LPIGELTLVTPVTESKEPIAVDMNPVGAWAEISLPAPTTNGRGPRLGGMGMGGAVEHGTSCHSVFGYSEVKHPALGAGKCGMASRH